MGKGGVTSILVGSAIVAALVGSSTASAATLTGDYQFQDSRASSGPGAPVTDVGVGGNTFASDDVFGHVQAGPHLPA